MPRHQCVPHHNSLDVSAPSGSTEVGNLFDVWKNITLIFSSSILLHGVNMPNNQLVFVANQDLSLADSNSTHNT
jgi:hypothetical protein